MNPSEDFLSVRLMAVHDMAVSDICRDNKRIIDVGSDHGHLSLYSLMNNDFEYAVLTDIHEDPAKRSEQTMRMYGMSDRSSVYCTDGLDGIELMIGDVIVMAGLGGNNMIDIMTRVLDRESEDLMRSLVWILQPQKSSDKLREFLFVNGFEIKDETSCEDREINYLIIKAVYTGKKTDYSLVDKFYGPVIMRKYKEGDPDIKLYVSRLDNRFDIAQRGNEEIRYMYRQRKEEEES